MENQTRAEHDFLAELPIKEQKGISCSKCHRLRKDLEKGAKDALSIIPRCIQAQKHSGLFFLYLAHFSEKFW